MPDARVQFDAPVTAASPSEDAVHQSRGHAAARRISWSASKCEMMAEEEATDESVAHAAYTLTKRPKATRRGEEHAESDDESVASRRERPNLRRRIFLTTNDPNYSPLAKAISLVMMGVIFSSTTAFILESEVCTTSLCANGVLPFEPWADLFYVIEWISVVLFTIEYNVRIATCGTSWYERYCFAIEPTNIIDLVAWLPFWINGFCQTPMFKSPALNEVDSGGASFIRAVRLIRIFRVFKNGRYSLGIKVFAGALKLSLQPMVILAVSGLVTMIILSSIIWMVERPDGTFVTDSLLALHGKERPAPGEAGLQDKCFGTIPNAAWWVLTTMTTVGYGDCFPITGLGKLIGVSTMCSGVIVLGLPITVLGSNFSKVTEMYEEDAAAFTMQDTTVDGMIDEEELRDFLRTKRREGLLRPDVDTSVVALMERYDPNVKGYLDGESFAKLQNDICIERKDNFAELEEKMMRRFELLEYKLGLVLKDDSGVLKGTNASWSERDSPRDSSRSDSPDGSARPSVRKQLTGGALPTPPDDPTVTLTC